MPELNARPVLVTGATGFTGGQLVHALAADGQRVRCIVRSSARAKGLPDGVEVLEGDITSAVEVRKAMDGVGTVYHLAAAYREASHEEEGYWRVNVGATKNLLEAATAARIERFVHCSTVGVHGHIANPPADET